MVEKYLKCKYYENSPMMTFSNEYLITFKIKCMNKINPSALIGSKEKQIEFPAKDEEWCIVNRRDVTVLGENNGLVKLLGLRLDEVKDSAYVSIRNLDGITGYKVPLEEIEIR